MQYKRDTIASDPVTAEFAHQRTLLARKERWRRANESWREHLAELAARRRYQTPENVLREFSFTAWEIGQLPERHG